MRMDFLTLFPGMFESVFGHSILARAAERGHVSFHTHDIRDYTDDKHNKVDDYPYGGGAGLVLKPQPVFDAAAEVKSAGDAPPDRVILLCPQGKPFKQEDARELAGEDRLMFICGHYEGYDERIREHLITDEYSIGDFVLTGGELGAMVMADSITRLLPGVLGNEQSAHTDSFEDGLLEYPQYTRPADFRGMTVPDILLSGDHGKIAEWRQNQAMKRTKERRPDLWEKYTDQT